MSGGRAGLTSFQGRVLSPAEAREYLDTPISEAEREGVLELVRWFRRRYPTPIERLTYVRRAYARWQRTRGMARQQRHGASGHERSTRSPDSDGA